MTPFRVGDRVVLRTRQTAAAPPAGLECAHRSRYGEDYTYVLDEYCRVASPPAADRVTLHSATGRTLSVRRNDPRLRRATIVERVLHADRFNAQRASTLKNDAFDYTFDWRGGS